MDNALEQSSRAMRLHTIGDVVASLSPDYPAISHSSLRFLEREGLVVPSRTPGGHRLYSDQDVARIRQIKQWQAERVTLQEIRNRLDRRGRLDEINALIPQFLNSALAGEGDQASALVLSADTIGVPLATLLEEVLRPALVAVGDGWAAGTISVAQEKEISEIVRGILAELSLRHRAGTGADTARIAVAASVEGERHDLGLRMISALLMSLGWTVHFLGADVATVFLIDAVARRSPSVVLLSVSLSEHLDSVKASISAIRDQAATFPAPRILVGGEAARLHHDEIVASGAEFADFASIAGRLALTPSMD